MIKYLLCIAMLYSVAVGIDKGSYQQGGLDKGSSNNGFPDLTIIDIIPDSAYWGDTVKVAFAAGTNIMYVDTFKIGDSAAVKIDTTGDTIAAIMPHVGVGMYSIAIYDESDSAFDSVYCKGAYVPSLLTISEISISTCSLNVACSLSVTNTDADSIIWQIKPFGGEWVDTLRKLATGADTLFRTPTYATRTDSIRAYVFNSVGADTSGTLWEPFYTTPTFDSCRAKVRRGTLWTDIKPLDTMYFFFSNIEDSTGASELWLNSTGTVTGELLSVTADSITVRIPTGTPRGIYRPRWTNMYGVQSEALTSSVGCPYVKSPSVGAY